MKTMRTLEYLLVHSASSCLVYLSAPSSHHWKPTSALHWNWICFLGYWNQWSHRAFEGFNIFSSNGRDGTPGFCAIKHLTKEELWLYRSFTQPKSGILFLLLSNVQKLYGVLWLTDPPFPLSPYPFYMFITFLTLMDHIYTLTHFLSIFIPFPSEFFFLFAVLCWIVAIEKQGKGTFFEEKNCSYLHNHS